MYRNKWVRTVTVLGILLIMSIYFSNFIYYVIFIAVHEFSHLICGTMLGYKYDQLHIMPFGLSLAFKEKFIRPFDDIIISVTGPLINFVFFVIFLIIGDNGYENLYVLKDVNLVLCIFNLIPAGFLDGGRILKSVVSCYKSIFLGHLLISLNGMIFGCIIIVVAMLRNFNLSSIVAAALGAFFIYRSYLTYKEINISIIKDVIYKQNYMYQSKSILVEHIAFSKEVKLIDVIKVFCFNKYYVIHLIENSKLTCRIEESDILKIYCAYGNITIMECSNYINT